MHIAFGLQSRGKLAQYPLVATYRKVAKNRPNVNFSIGPQAGLLLNHSDMDKRLSRLFVLKEEKSRTRNRLRII